MYRYGIETDYSLIKKEQGFCLNCTVMELKLIFSVFYQNFRLGLNCTVMELKQCIIRYINSDKRSLNCTVMELKQIIR